MKKNTLKIKGKNIILCDKHVSTMSIYTDESLQINVT